MPRVKICFSAVLTAVCFLLLFPLRRLLPVAGAVVLHEGGHLVAMALTRTPVTSVMIYPFGAEIRTLPSSCGKECIVALAGGVCNLAAFLLFRGRFPVFAGDCLVLGLLNLLPVQGLDGGEVLGDLCCLTLSPVRAQNVCLAVSYAALFLTWVLASYLLLMRGELMLFVLCLFLFARQALSFP